MVECVCQLATLLSVNVQVVSMELDVKIAIIVCLIHALIMAFVHKQQLVTFAHVRIHSLELIAKK